MIYRVVGFGGKYLNKEADCIIYAFGDKVGEVSEFDRLFGHTSKECQDLLKVISSR